MYHVAVPLQVKGEIVGLLSVVCQDEVCQEDLGLLEAVGRQVGVGIENARLWEELQRKEAVRRELLHKWRMPPTWRRPAQRWPACGKW